MQLLETLRHNSPKQLYLTHRAKGHVEDVMATIDLDAFFELRKKAKERTKNLNNLKYFNIQAYMQRHMRRALGLHLDHYHRQVLDIGTGFGYFPYICRFFGSNTLAMDVPDHPLFDDITNFLGVKKLHQPIVPLQPVVGLGRHFDLVTAFQVAFNRFPIAGVPGWRPWGDEEWTFFLEDIFNNVLKEGGEIALEMNYSPISRAWVTPEERKAFRRYKTRIFGADVRLRRDK
jgi:hypothetical protein